MQPNPSQISKTSQSGLIYLSSYYLIIIFSFQKSYKAYQKASNSLQRFFLMWETGSFMTQILELADQESNWLMEK